MSREIKFRAWFKAGKNTNYVMKQDTDLSLVFKLNNKGGFEKYHAEDYILMQYTGLKDKNGVEIYEGDIVRWTLNPMGGEPETNHMPVERLNNGLYIPHINNTSEVIGNIYEHSHLLKEEE